MNLLAARKRTLTGTLMVVLSLTGCGLFDNSGRVITGSGTEASETRAVSGIEAVALLGSGEVIITQGATEGLTVEAEDNLLPLITAEMEGGTLELGFDRPDWASAIRPTRPIRFLVSVRDLAGVDLAGSGNMTAPSLTTSDFEINLTGSGNVSVDGLTAADVRAVISGSGNINLAGTTESQAVTISGAGDYDAGDLESQSAEITVSGSGNVTAWVEATLSIRISGSGTVNYFGQPSVTRRDITGSGDINPMGSK